MKLRYTVLSLLAIGGAALFMANSNGSTLADLTGAPGSSGTCANCHGNLNSGTGISLAGLPSEYIPGQTYTLTLSLDNATTANGFQLTIRDAANNTPGSFTQGTGSNVKSSGSRSTIQHSSPSSTGSWTFDWTAPSSDAGNLTVYATGNATNGNGTTSGDQVYSMSFSLNSAQASSVTNPENQEVIIYPVNNHSSIQVEGLKEVTSFQVVDLNGKLLQQGTYSPGSLIDVSELPAGYFFLRLQNNQDMQALPFVKP